jgi:putative alpha-1,2-mannosidase
MYPVIPGVGGVVLGTPLFAQATIRLGNGGVLEVHSTGEGVYVQSVNLNGKPYTSSWLPIDKLTSGRNRLEFVLGNKPGSWATAPASFPPSFDVN